MSRSLVVDQRYRLQAADLAGARHRAVIRQVSFQGLEELTPVLHFDGPLHKHLALNTSQRRELVETLRSSLCDDWVGQPIALRAGRHNDGPAILIERPTTPGLVREVAARWPMRTFPAPSAFSAWVMLAVVLAALFWLAGSEALIDLILDWIR